MINTEFLKDLREYIDDARNSLSCVEETYINYPNEFTPTAKEMINKKKYILDKLEQDYFSPFMVNIDNIKKFDADGNLISEGEKEKTTIEQLEEGLLKLFNKYVETVENNIENYILDDNNYITSLCPIVDRLLKIESDKKLSQEYFKN